MPEADAACRSAHVCYNQINPLNMHEYVKRPERVASNGS